MDQQTVRDQYQLNGWAALFCILGAIAVILGAFGAHGLEDQISPDSLDTYKTGVLYHFLHVFIGLIAVLTSRQQSGRLLIIGCWSFLLGILLFSGSLYLLSTTELTGLNLNFLGPVTPIGGLLFISGWITIAIHYLKKR